LSGERPLEPPAVNRLGEIQIPTLVIVGELDHPEVVARAETLERRIPDAYRIVILGVANMPSL
jgi:pimeloyl-ACP methyl ester carboxylesterase